jgi:hypothetical protein
MRLDAASTDSTTRAARPSSKLQRWAGENARRGPLPLDHRAVRQTKLQFKLWETTNWNDGDTKMNEGGARSTQPERSSTCQTPRRTFTQAFASRIGASPIEMTSSPYDPRIQRGNVGRHQGSDRISLRSSRLNAALSFAQQSSQSLRRQLRTPARPSRPRFFFSAGGTSRHSVATYTDCQRRR